MIAFAALLVALPVEVELSAGAVTSSDVPSAPTAMALRIGGAVAVNDYVSLGASLLGIPGNDSQCGYTAGFFGNSSFKAISGFATARLHSSGTYQFFLDGGVGVGHLISLSGSDYCPESPVYRGGGGIAFWLGGGFRAFVTKELSLGLQLAATTWSNASHSGHMGTPEFPAESGLTVVGSMLLLSVGWSFGR